MRSGAQVTINSFTREKLKTFARTRYEDLENFFNEYADPQGKDLQLFTRVSKKIPDVMDQLWDCFGATNSKALTNRSYILSVYLFMEELSGGGTSFPKKQQKPFMEFVLKLWRRLKDEMRQGMDRSNRELYSFETLVSSAPGEAYQIERRHAKLVEYYSYFQQHGKIKGD
jgi:hypothetical protein